MNNYQDKWGRFHHKPCINGEPSSNNGFLYSAYAKKAGIEVDYYKIHECMMLCYKLKPVPHFTRNPDQDLPPISRDEILGLAYLNLSQDDGDGNFWNFSPYPIPKFSLTKLLSQLWELRPSLIPVNSTPILTPRFKLEYKHRNYFWQNNLDQLYRFAFSVPLQDRYFILKCWDKFQWYNPVHLLYKGIAAVDKIGSPSGIRFLKYDGEKNKAAMVQEFPVDHDIRVKVGYEV
jgi:hypothetical protein